MNLTSITDDTLLTNILCLVDQERELLTKVLTCLKEIERRRLFSDLGYKSLFDFTVHHLKYTEAQAYRRISAMRMLRELPQLEEKISTGEISLTHIGLAQAYFREEEKHNNQQMKSSEKLEVFNQIANKSVREAEKFTLSLSTAPEVSRPDSIKAVSSDRIEMKFYANERLRKKIEDLRGLLAHKAPNISLGDLFEQLCDLGLSQWSITPDKFAAPKKRCVNSLAEQSRQVFLKAKNKCTNCGSTYALEIDHIIPQAKGGSSESDNLRLLCRACNQRSAIREFGIKKMDSYINRQN
jgi:hypothetical protein